MSTLRDAAAQVRRTVRTSGLLWTSSLVLDRVGIPALRFWKSAIYSKGLLANQVAAILGGWGMSPKHAAGTVELLLYADLHGIDSHGCAMLIDYHRSLVQKRIMMTPVIQIVRESATTALMDGGGGLGHVPAEMAMKLAISKCRESGIGAVAVRNSGHYGAAGAYAAMATQAGLIGVASTNTRTPSVVPTFGIEAMFGTNPIAIAAPTKKNRPFLLDMATSTAPIGKLMNAWRGGNSIPYGWALNPEGMPETNARRAAGYRRLTPLGSTREMGSHKGYGLAAAVEIVCSILPGLRAAQKPDEYARAGHFFLAMDPARFRELGEFETDLDSMMDSLRTSKPFDPKEPVQVAGDPEYAAFDERSRNGIPLTRTVIEDIRAICRDSNVPFLLDGK